MEYYNSLINPILTSWYPTPTTSLSPTSTMSISFINPTNTQGLLITFLNLQRQFQTETNSISLYFLSKQARGALASYTIIKNELILQTATQTIESSQITQELLNSTLNLKQLEWNSNLYGMNLSVPFNLLFSILFVFLFLHQCIMCSRSVYFSLCMICGSFLEFLGYLSRTIAHYSYTDPNLYLCQIISLTMAPVFIMAAIYYLFAKLVVVYGTHYLSIAPVHLSYMFIIFDIVSLVIQAIGGGIAATDLRLLKDSNVGSWVMLSGIAFQCLSMTVFLLLMIKFLLNIYQVKCISQGFKFWKCLFGIGYQELEPHFDPKYEKVRLYKRIFKYMPLAILSSVLFIYIRCVYRVIELSQGWRGYLITHEEYVLTLDALMVLLACLIYLAFHPGFVFGKHKIQLRHEIMQDNMSEKHEISQPYLNPKLKLPPSLVFNLSNTIDSKLNTTKSDTITTSTFEP